MGAKIRYSKEVKFHPYVGAKYDLGLRKNIKVLVVGESHYGDPPINKNFTTNVISADIYNSEKIAKVFWDNVAKALEIKYYNSIAPEKVKETFNNIAFYNFVQSLLPDPKFRPTKEMFKNSEAAFIEILDKLKPDFVLCLGSTFWHNIQSAVNWNKSFIRFSIKSKDASFIYEKEQKNTYFYNIYHPSYWRRGKDIPINTHSEVVKALNKVIGLNKQK